jgi:nucleoside-diphosphate-sugar epimerase
MMAAAKESEMDFNGQRVLVTGGAGFLGANLCHALAARGAKVTALDGFLFGGGANPANLEGAGVELVRADIREVDLRPLCEGVSVIFNLAAQTSHMGGQKDPLADIAVNAVAQVRLIQAAREASPDAVVVHASTRQFYGRPHYLPVDEKHPVAPPDANGVSKFAGEQYWMIEHRTAGRPVVSLRLTNCYGPRLRIRDARRAHFCFVRPVLLGGSGSFCSRQQKRVNQLRKRMRLADDVLHDADSAISECQALAAVEKEAVPCAAVLSPLHADEHVGRKRRACGQNIRRGVGALCSTVQKVRKHQRRREKRSANSFQLGCTGQSVSLLHNHLFNERSCVCARR